MDTNNYHVDSKGYYGCFGGAYVPEILRRAVETLQENYLPIMQSESFRREYDRLLRDKRVTSVLVGASSSEQLLDSLGALDGPDFSSDELQRIEQILA